MKVRQVLKLAGEPAPVIKRPSELRAAIEDSVRRLGEERDRLRELVENAESVLESCGDAGDQIDRALDTLSQYV
jgi:ABC-type transporter Mla subunit MlaD